MNAVVLWCAVAWAVVAVLALGGWATFIVLYSRATLTMANAFLVHEKVDRLIDDRIARVVERIREREGRRTGPPVRPPDRPETSGPNAAADALRSIFGGDGPLIEPMTDQPDAQLEVVS